MTESCLMTRPWTYWGGGGGGGGGGLQPGPSEGGGGCGIFQISILGKKRNVWVKPLDFRQAM